MLGVRLRAAPASRQGNARRRPWVLQGRREVPDVRRWKERRLDGHAEHQPNGSALPLASFEAERIPADVPQTEGRCPLCGEVMRFEQGLSVDHIRPLSLGGTNVQANKQLTHAECNWRKGNGVVRPASRCKCVARAKRANPRVWEREPTDDPSATPPRLAL